eukprot:2374962-Prymnesium_polylepis.3
MATSALLLRGPPLPESAEPSEQVTCQLFTPSTEIGKALAMLMHTRTGRTRIALWRKPQSAGGMRPPESSARDRRSTRVRAATFWLQTTEAQARGQAAATRKES